MIKESYVSLETAKLLKEHGFRAKCTACYRQDLNNQFELISGRIDFCAPRFSKCKSLPPLNAPTHQMAIEWIRQTKAYHIEIRVAYHFRVFDGYTFEIFNLAEEEYVTTLGVFSLAHEAADAAIKFVLEKLDN